jgi:hypothetical protein
LTLVVNARDAADARTLAENAENNMKLVRSAVAKLSADKKQRAAMEALFGGVKVTRKGSVVTLTAALSAEQSNDLLGEKARKK